MPLDARTRSSIYGNFAEILGDHDSNALMSEFPSVEAEELVTKQFLRAELGLLRSELEGEIGTLRSEPMGEIGTVRSELTAEIGGLRSNTDRPLAGLRLEMAERFHRQTVWLASTVVASAGFVTAAVPLLSCRAPVITRSQRPRRATGDVFDVEVGVEHRRHDAGVAELALDLGHADARSDELGGEGVPPAVRVVASGQPASRAARRHSRCSAETEHRLSGSGTKGCV